MKKKKMTKQTALKIMLKQWDHSGMYGCNKEDSINNLGLPEDMESSCACCEYVRNKYTEEYCYHCLINWPDTQYRQYKSAHPCYNSYFGEWENNYESNEAKELAHKMADLALDKLNELYPEDLARVKQWLKQLS